ncbi:PDZ domain-containing protein [Salinibacterium sp. SWN139]|uniref:YlbL family protein n=1 Tax=Salinibacterium sp. SWN139 TaxID=2792055 RepID=UPI0018CD1610|nr:S16 family serine protease [Salinibacterium sp. SWN139]MBH0054585.1 PDZ domain-containing protein [Salinibacterium sp. SWN139]
MALFTDNRPEPSSSRARSGWLGWLVLSVALVGTLLATLVPSPYIIEQPGPVYDTLGDVEIEGALVPLIQIPVETTYPTEGALDMLTVNVLGNPDSPLSWFEVGAAYFDRSKAIVPVEAVYPVGVTVEESTEAGAIQMETSQQEAIAAALSDLGYEFDATLTVAETSAGGPSEGVLEAGDIIRSVNGETFADVAGLRDEIAANGTTTPAEVVFEREDEELTVEITPTMSEGDDAIPIIGVVVGSAYNFPVDVKIQLENVGGPSAGMMFALGIIDKLTPGAINGGTEVAGTGTITATGDVGPIGGIQQKMYGAQAAGADFFLAPVENCDEVAENTPKGLTVYAVDDLNDALVALASIRGGLSGAGLPTCNAS